MPSFTVQVLIENKPGISDPEGATILKDLVLKGKHSSVKKIRTGKMIKFQINEKTKDAAKKKVKKICDDLRIYNPLVSKITLEIFEN